MTKLAGILDMRRSYLHSLTDILLKEKDPKSNAPVLAHSCLGTFIQYGLMEVVDKIDELIHSKSHEGTPEIRNIKQLIWWSAALTKAVVDDPTLRSVAASSIVTPAVLDLCLDASDLGQGWGIVQDCGIACKAHGLTKVAEPVASESAEDWLYRETEAAASLRTATGRSARTPGRRTRNVSTSTRRFSCRSLRWSPRSRRRTSRGWCAPSSPSVDQGPYLVELARGEPLPPPCALELFDALDLQSVGW